MFGSTAPRPSSAPPPSPRPASPRPASVRWQSPGSPSPRPRSGWRGRASAGLAVLAAAVLAAAALSPSTAAAADTTVSVDLGSQGAAPNSAGSGFLYGLSQDGSGPADSLLQPLKPTLFRGGGARIAGGGWLGDGYSAGSGYRIRVNSALSQARRVTAAPYHATYHLLVSDVWGADTTQPSNTVYPCDNGDCSNWKAYVDQLVSDVQASGVTVAYDIWNEPDGTGFWQRGVNSAQYYQMWDTAVREIHRLQPSAKIVGPSYSGYNHGWLDGFLGQTKTDNTLPDVVNWHFGTDPAADAADARSLLSAHGIGQLPLTINEYLFSQQQNSGYTAWFLDRLAASGVSAAAHAIWTDCCGAGTLDSLLVGGQPTGQWWVYQAYAQLSGKMLGTTNSGGIAVAASADSGAHRAFALIGNNSGQGGTTTVNFQNLSAASYLLNNGKVHVKVQRIPDQNPLSAPATVLDSDLAPDGGTLHVPVSMVSGTDAYTVTLTAGNGSTGPVQSTVTVDGADTAAGDADHFSYGANWGVTNGVGDMYDGTADWSYTAGAQAAFHFTGSKVALHAVRDVDQGRMSLSLDGGAPVTVDDYAASRNASGVVWTSAQLASGSHTLTITNTGDRNSASSGTNIAVDSADVWTP
jgi:Glycosyl hydrolases family 39